MSAVTKRRRASLIVNFWIYRRLVALAVVLGLLLWFIITNNQKVAIAFPFGLPTVEGTTGLVILISAFFGAATTALSMTVVWAIRRNRNIRISQAHVRLRDETEERPPADYASKTGEGFSNLDW